MIKYGLYGNAANQKDGQLHGRVHHNKTISTKALIKKMVAKKTTIGEAEIVGAVSLLGDVLAESFKDGFGVTLDGVGTLTLSINGQFDGAHDSFDPERHQLNINIRPSVALVKQLNTEGDLHKEEASSPAPALNTLTDVVSKTRNEILTQGHLCTVRGYRLRFDAAQMDEGVFLIDNETQKAYKVEEVSKNMPSEIIFNVPTIDAVHVTLQVRSRLGRNVKTLRVGTLSGRLRVEKSV